MRELKEEGDLEVEIERFLGVFENYFTPKEPYPYCHNHEYNLIFKASLKKNYDVSIGIKQIEDCIKLVWVPLIDIIKVDFRPEPLRNILIKWLNSTNSDNFETIM